MALIREWSMQLNANAGISRTTTGAATQAGNTLFVDLVLRSDRTALDGVTVTDNASNTWTLVSSVSSSSMGVYMFMAVDAQPVTSVTAAWLDDGGQSFEAPSIIAFAEYSNVGALLSEPTTVVTSGGEGGMPSAIPAVEGALVRAVGGASLSSRTWGLISQGVTPVARSAFYGNQTEIMRADAYVAMSGNVAIGWERLTGSSAALSVVNAVFVATDIVPEAEELSMAAATGWTSVVGESNRLHAISDDLDESYIETSENPTNETVQLTLPAIEPPASDLAVSLRLSATGAAGQIVPELYVPATSSWVAATTITVTGSATNYTVTWPLAAIGDITPQEWGSGVNVRLIAQVG